MFRSSGRLSQWSIWYASRLQLSRSRRSFVAQFILTLSWILLLHNAARPCSCLYPGLCKSPDHQVTRLTGWCQKERGLSWMCRKGHARFIDEERMGATVYPCFTVFWRAVGHGARLYGAFADRCAERPLWTTHSVPTVARGGIAAWIRRGRTDSTRGNAKHDDERQQYNTCPAGKPVPSGHIGFLSVCLARSPDHLYVLRKICTCLSYGDIDA